MRHQVVCISGADGAGAEENRSRRRRAARLSSDQRSDRRASRPRGRSGAGASRRRGAAQIGRRARARESRADQRGRGVIVRLYRTGAGEPLPAGAELRALIGTAIEETAAEGEAVIVAHAASVVLGGRDDTRCACSSPRRLTRAPDGSRKLVG